MIEGNALTQLTDIQYRSALSYEGILYRRLAKLLVSENTSDLADLLYQMAMPLNARMTEFWDDYMAYVEGKDTTLEDWPLFAAE